MSSVHETGADAVFDGLLNELRGIQAAMEKALEGRELNPEFRTQWANHAADMDLFCVLARCESCNDLAWTKSRPGFGVFCASCDASLFTDCVSCGNDLRRGEAVPTDRGDMHQDCYTVTLGSAVA